ncbi:hypothetical protein NLG97_g5659 [Lecanicillium saksenae]|uniref:Uncharacterized protein n=1 Tax=Lecanicillium saksenae TaxID=468837 RepID=A0ACC1QU76_9HYPO|nr:hypothetical protein NLG97_g5659 [Lecanicillium saksenae]
MVLKLEPVRFADRDIISRIFAQSFYAMRIQQRLFPNVSLEDKTENAIKKWPFNYSRPNTARQKIVNSETGEVVSYAAWEFFNIDASDLATDISDMPEDCKMDEAPRSKGLDTIFAETVESQLARLDLELQNLKTGQYMSLVTIGTIPKYQGSGAGSIHMKWAAQVADEKRIPIYIEAAQEAVQFYMRHGYEVVKTVEVDMGAGDPIPYSMSAMTRQPT